MRIGSEDWYAGFSGGLLDKSAYHDDNGLYTVKDYWVKYRDEKVRVIQG